MKRNVVLTVLLFVLLIGLLLIGFNSLEKTTNEEDYKRIEENIRTAVMACYSIEGSYPESIEYLRDNYGLYFNEDLYQVHYRYLGSNVIPEYKVFTKGNQ